jgi:ABC-type transporter Mla MlaB component
MLEVYIHDGPASLRFVLKGSLSNGDCHLLAGAWETALSIATGKELSIDTTRLASIDSGGHSLLADLRASGATILQSSPVAPPARRCLFNRWFCREYA